MNTVEFDIVQDSCCHWQASRFAVIAVMRVADVGQREPLAVSLSLKMKANVLVSIARTKLEFQKESRDLARRRPTGGIQ